MEFEDSRKALFVEPNAYVQTYNAHKQNRVGSKKVVFQEPYDCLPNYHMNNDFKKGNCDCVSKVKNQQEQKTDAKTINPFSFDLKSLMPMLGALGGKSAGGIGNILSSFSGGEGSFDFGKIMGLLMQNKDGLGSILNMFSQKKSASKNGSKTDLKSTDFEIKNYTKV